MLDNSNSTIIDVCIIDGEHMSFGNSSIFIDQDVNFKINDHIKKYLGCQQHRNKTNTTFLTTSELLKMLE